MAKLIAPIIAVRGQNSRGKIAGKWHLLKTSSDGFTTVCNLYFGKWTKEPVKNIKADDICKKCHGAITVED